jgi:hypothetical protein
MTSHPFTTYVGSSARRNRKEFRRPHDPLADVLQSAIVTGTQIRIFLPDGNPEGVRLVYKSHWPGVAVASPRSRYAQARVERVEFRTPGVYVLIGPSEDPKYEARIYVGEGEDPRGRIDNHHTNKDFWNRLILFTSFGQALNKATIRYVEARLLQLAAAAARAELDNGNAPGLPPLAEPDREDAESFLQDMLVIYPVLGIGLFEPLEQTAGPDRLRLEGPQASGEGAETEDGFVVYAGAQARTSTVDSMPDWATHLRETLVTSGALVPTEGGESLRLESDYEFKSPSAAAAVLLGRSAAGPIEWKNAAGKTLKQIREDAVATTAAPASPNVVA